MTHTATFTLVTDNAGVTTPDLTFNPLVDPSKEEAPAIYNFMSRVAIEFLKEAGLVDDDNLWVSQEAADGVHLTLGSPSSTTEH